MDSNTLTEFQFLHQQFSQIYSDFRLKALSPHEDKTPKEWGITEAAEMVGRSPQTIRNYEDCQKLPEPKQIKKGKRTERVYSLREINQLREFFKTRKKKPKNCTPAKIGFVNFKGGAAKTTTAVCAAQYLTKEGYKVLLVDCDSQASSTQMFGYIPDEHFSKNETILEILTGESEDISKNIKKTHWDGLDLLPANLSLYNAELVIPYQIVQYATDNTGKQLDFYNRLNKAINAIENNYDIIIFDCPPSMGMISINAIYAATALIISMPPVMIDFASTKEFFKMMCEVLERMPAKKYDFIRLLITRHNGRPNATDITDLIKFKITRYAMKNNMIESEVVSKAASNMQTLYEIDKDLCNKKTYTRAIEHADKTNDEIEKLITESWENQNTDTINTIERSVEKGVFANG